MGGKPPETSVIKEVMEMSKTALELALVLLRILKEVLGLIRDIKDLRRPKAKR